MHSVAKFVTKAYLVSGSFEHIKEVCFQAIYLKGLSIIRWVSCYCFILTKFFFYFFYFFLQDLPDTIHIGGRISPHTVWEYVGKLKTSLSKVWKEKTFHIH